MEETDALVFPLEDVPSELVPPVETSAEVAPSPEVSNEAVSVRPPRLVVRMNSSSFYPYIADSFFYQNPRPLSSASGKAPVVTSKSTVSPQAPKFYRLGMPPAQKPSTNRKVSSSGSFYSRFFVMFLFNMFLLASKDSTLSKVSTNPKGKSVEFPKMAVSRKRTANSPPPPDKNSSKKRIRISVPEDEEVAVESDELEDEDTDPPSKNTRSSLRIGPPPKAYYYKQKKPSRVSNFFLYLIFFFLRLFQKSNNKTKTPSVVTETKDFSEDHKTSYKIASESLGSETNACATPDGHVVSGSFSASTTSFLRAAPFSNKVGYISFFLSLPL